MTNDLVIIGGDLNLNLNPDKDRKGNRLHAHTNSAEFLNTHMVAHEWVDI